MKDSLCQEASMSFFEVSYKSGLLHWSLPDLTFPCFYLKYIASHPWILNQYWVANKQVNFPILMSGLEQEPK